MASLARSLLSNAVYRGRRFPAANASARSRGPRGASWFAYTPARSPELSREANRRPWDDTTAVGPGNRTDPSEQDVSGRRNAARPRRGPAPSLPSTGEAAPRVTACLEAGFARGAARGAVGAVESGDLRREPARRTVLTALVLILVGSLVGPTACGGTTSSPRQTLDRYIQAAERGDCDALYSMMTEEVRARTPREDFCQALSDNPEELREEVSALRQVAGEPEITARVTYGLGDQMVFVYEDGQWRIDTPVLDFYPQDTPRAALRSFIRAIERRRYDVILRFVPNEYRESMSAEQLRELWEGPKREEIEQLLENLRASVEEPIEVVGDRATMQYMERYTCRFIREDGVWKIEDPD